MGSVINFFLLLESIYIYKNKHDRRALEDLLLLLETGLTGGVGAVVKKKIAIFVTI